MEHGNQLFLLEVLFFTKSFNLCADDILCHYDFLYHDTVNYKGLSKAKQKKIPAEASLEKYGVSNLYYRGRYEEKAPVPSAEKVSRKKEMPAPEKTAVLEEAVVSAPTETEKRTADDSAALMAGLDPVSCRIFAQMPIDRAVSPDQMALPDVAMSELMTSLTLLELSGLVTSLPGGLYVRK